NSRASPTGGTPARFRRMYLPSRPRPSCDPTRKTPIRFHRTRLSMRSCMDISRSTRRLAKSRPASICRWHWYRTSSIRWTATNTSASRQPRGSESPRRPSVSAAGSPSPRNTPNETSFLFRNHFHGGPSMLPARAEGTGWASAGRRLSAEQWLAASTRRKTDPVGHFPHGDGAVTGWALSAGAQRRLPAALHQRDRHDPRHRHRQHAGGRRLAWPHVHPERRAGVRGRRVARGDIRVLVRGRKTDTGPHVSRSTRRKTDAARLHRRRRYLAGWAASLRRR